jgi:hypothetical protein
MTVSLDERMLLVECYNITDCEDVWIGRDLKCGEDVEESIVYESGVDSGRGRRVGTKESSVGATPTTRRDLLEKGQLGGEKWRCTYDELSWQCNAIRRRDFPPGDNS